MLSVYRASAGSGKTYTLAYRYIRLLLGTEDPETGTPRLYKGGDRHRSILAITFTNKATDEMKRRILHELAVLAGMEKGWEKPSPYLNRLTAFYHATPEQIARSAREALLHLLFDFNYFQVSTIDAFFQMILRTFAREAELTGNYELELDSKYAVRMGVDELLSSVNREADSPASHRVVKWISDYLLREMNEGRFSNLFDRSNNFYHVFVDFINDISDETFAYNYKPIMEYLSDPDRLTRFQAGLYRIIEDRRKEALQAVTSALEAKSRSACEIAYNRYLYSALEKWQANAGAVAASSTVGKVADDIEEAYTAAGKKQRAGGNYDPALEGLTHTACLLVRSFDTETAILRETAKNLFVLGLLERVYTFISDYRSENNTLLLSDTNSLLHDIIGKDDTPFVYERVGVWFHNFLIDEFQDTSSLQWANLQPLLAQGLSFGHSSLIIGDEKQCIYRFRDSDPTLLGSEVSQQFGAFLAPPSDDDDKGNNNWRSSREVVQFNNRLFSTLARLCGFEEIYANVEQQIDPQRDAPHGYVKVQYAEVAKDDNPHEAALKILGDDIDRQLRSGYSPGRIAILTRWRSEATRCIEYLEKRQQESGGFCRPFRVISDDAMLLGASPAVRLIVSVLRFTDNSALKKADNISPEESKPRAAVATLANRFEYISSNGIDPSQALTEALQWMEDENNNENEAATTNLNAETADDTYHNLDDDELTGGHASLSSLVDYIIEHYLRPSTRGDENMYISAFQDVVLDYSHRSGNDLHGFLSWWDINRTRLTVSAPEENDAIRVMTIHKSKGLEFDCVHIPFADWSLTSQRSYEWFIPSGLEGYPQINAGDIPPLLPFKPRDMEGTAYEPQYRTLMQEQRLDELNVMYVAFTRAVDELCVTFTAKASSSKDARKKSSKKKTMADDLSSGTVEMKSTGELLQTLSSQATAEDTGWIYEMGLPTTARESKKEKLTALDPTEQIAMAPYKSHPRKDLWENTRLETLPELLEGRPRERGLVLHDVMSHINTSGDLHGVIMRLVRQGRMRSCEAPEVESHLRHALDTVRDMGWFDGTRRVICEREIVLPSGKTRRPDRIVWTAEGTVDIIDYKFGEEDPTEYSAQVRRYMRLLRNLGYRSVRGFIWYIDRHKIVTVE